MHRSIYVFTHDADPRIDSPAYFISPFEAQQRLAAGYVRFISPTAVQYKPPPDWQPEIDRRGLFDKVWQPRFSDHYLVWQMWPEPEPEL